MTAPSLPIRSPRKNEIDEHTRVVRDLNTFLDFLQKRVAELEKKPLPAAKPGWGQQ